MEQNNKPKGHIAVWAIIILSLAIAGYYVINKYVDTNKDTTNETANNTNDNIAVDRALTTTEQTFFLEYFLTNPGFLRNFYNSPDDLSIPMILEKAQGTNHSKSLTIAEQQKIITTDFPDNPETVLNVIIDGNLMRTLYQDNTGQEYSNSDSTLHWTYNSEYDVYYNAIPYGEEGSYPNVYTFSNIKITNDNYKIAYTAYYQPTTDSPDYDVANPDNKEILYSGIVTLKKISTKHYHFISNVENNN